MLTMDMPGEAMENVEKPKLVPNRHHSFIEYLIPDNEVITRISLVFEHILLRN